MVGTPSRFMAVPSNSSRAASGSNSTPSTLSSASLRPSARTDNTGWPSHLLDRAAENATDFVAFKYLVVTPRYLHG